MNIYLTHNILVICLIYFSTGLIPTFMLMARCVSVYWAHGMAVTQQRSGTPNTPTSFRFVPNILGRGEAIMRTIVMSSS